MRAQGTIVRNAGRLAAGAALGLLSMTLAGPLAAEQVGAVRAVQTYAYGTPPQGQRLPKYPRDGVVVDEYLETVEKGAMIVRFRDDTELTLGENARVLVDRFVFDPRTSEGEQLVSVTRGAFRFVSGRMRKEGISIETPVSTIGVRGTTVVGDHDADTETSRISVVDGEAIIRPFYQVNSIVVRAGQTILIRPGGSNVVPTAGFRATKQDQVDRLGLQSQRTGFIGMRGGKAGQQGDRYESNSSSSSIP
ncbi:MAG: FecR domain-containing protein [Alphaproteobacteria bacterium]|nr:FecR domain-containing protein [Alphaproteobacteria bacterium]